jgi:hypothetical protein
MTAKEIGLALSAWLCLAIVLTANLGAADQGCYGPYSSAAPQTAQERADLLKLIQKMEERREAASGEADLYQMLQNPYAFKDIQAALEGADTHKALQKLNSIYYGPESGDGWRYWTSMWLKGPEKGDAPDKASAYGLMDNPYAFKDPQAALERADTYKAIQKLNSLQHSPRGLESWYYWANIWLNRP